MKTLSDWTAILTTGRIVASALTVLLIILAVVLLRKAASTYIEDQRARYRVRKLATTSGYVLVFVIIAMGLGGSLASFGITVGVLAAGIALALKEVVTSVAGWFAISFGNLYKIGDRVAFAGVRGDVIDIGVLRTTIMEIGEWIAGDLYTGRIVRTSNASLFQHPVFNYSRDFPFLWDELTLPVGYGSDLQSARDILERVLTEVVGQYAEFARDSWKSMAAKYMVETSTVEPLVTLTANSNWVEFTARYPVDYRERRKTRDRLFSRILADIDATDGKVSIGSATFGLVEAPPLEVKLQN